MMVSTVIEGAHSQRYFAEHLPRLTDVIEGEDSVTKFYTELVFKAIKLKTTNKPTPIERFYSMLKPDSFRN